MGLIKGLDLIPPNSVLCVQEKNGNIKSIFAISVASERARVGIPVKYLSLRTREDIHHKMEQLRIPGSENLEIVEIQPGHAKREVLSRIQEPSSPLIIIDPFSVFFAEDSFMDLNNLLLNLISASRKGTTYLLLIDIGVLSDRQENLVRAMADGIIEFVVLPEGDRLNYYINIPKMRGVFPQNKMLPFTVNEEGLLIDTRERHG